MGYYEKDVYYNPEDFGLTIVASVDWLDGGYEYDMTVVWVDENGQYYWGNSSGCSCTSPFEMDNSVDDLKKATKFQCIEYLQSRLAETYFYSTREAEAINNEVVQAIEKLVLS